MPEGADQMEFTNKVWKSQNLESRIRNFEFEFAKNENKNNIIFPQFVERSRKLDVTVF